MQAVNDIRQFRLPQNRYTRGPVASCYEKYRIVQNRPGLNGRLFQVQNTERDFLPASLTSYTSHSNDPDVQQMQGTKPVTTVRDISWFFRCVRNKSIGNVLSGSDAAVFGFGPKIQELFVPHLDNTGTIVTPLAKTANRIWGVDFLFDRVFDAAISISDPANGGRETMPFPGYRNNPFPKRIFARMEDEFVPDLYSTRTEDYLQAASRINLVHSGVEDIPEGLMPPLEYATAVGLLDAKTFGIYCTISGMESDDFFEHVDEVRTFFKRAMSMLKPGGLLAIGRGGFAEGQHVNFHRIFLELAAELGFSMVYMMPENEEFHDKYPWCESQHLFGFVNSRQSDLMLIKYPFPLDAFKRNRLGGESFMDAEWVSEEAIPGEISENALSMFRNPALDFTYRMTAPDRK